MFHAAVEENFSDAQKGFNKPAKCFALIFSILRFLDRVNSKSLRNRAYLSRPRGAKTRCALHYCTQYFQIRLHCCSLYSLALQPFKKRMFRNKCPPALHSPIKQWYVVGTRLAPLVTLPLQQIYDMLVELCAPKCSRVFQNMFQNFSEHVQKVSCR